MIWINDTTETHQCKFFHSKLIFHAGIRCTDVMALVGELTGPQIEDILHRQTIGRIGCHQDGQTYIVPITYVYDGEGIIGLSAPGKKIDMMRRNPQVCFQTDLIHSARQWQSVVAWGHYDELRGDQAIEALEVFAARLAGHMPSTTSQLTASTTGQWQLRAVKTVVFKITLGKKTGRFEAPAGFSDIS